MCASGRWRWTSGTVRVRARRYAWYVFMAMAVIPFLFFIYIALNIGADAHASINRTFTEPWFIGSVAFLIIASPIAFFLRSRWFKGYWSGDCVAPRNYLI